MRSTRRTLSLGIVLSGLLAGGICLRAGAQSAMNVQKMTLKNGLTILALEDHTVPSVAYYTFFKVGSRNEHPGITGLSHLFEHMMFNGSAKYKPKVFDQLIETGGGYSNAFTNSDSTEYQEEFSSATLNTVISLEADRMRALKLDKANIGQERGIVKEERRMRYDNSVEGEMSELLVNNLFVASTYHWDVIGFMKDLDIIKLEDAKAYFKTYYAPNNAVVCVVGDFKTPELFKQIEKNYSNIPAQVAPPKVVNIEPEQTGEKRIEFRHLAELPSVTFGYRGISFKASDEGPLNILSAILSSGESSRLYKSLVYEKQIATSVSANNDSRLDPGMFTFYAQAQKGHTAKECEDAIYAAIDEIKANGVTSRELQKAKNGLRVGFVNNFKTNLGMSQQIAEYQANYGDWKKVYNYLPKHDKVTIADVKRVANKYFISKNRTVITLIPETEAPAPQALKAGNK